VLIVDDATDDLQPEPEGRSVDVIPDKGSFALNLNEMLRRTSPADVAILEPGCAVGAGWLERLERAAGDDPSTTGSATAMANGALFLSVPELNTPLSTLPRGWLLEDAAAAVARSSQRQYPSAPSALAHCVLFRRDALDLVGDADESLDDATDVIVDLAQRIAGAGLKNIVADDVLVETGVGTARVASVAQSLSLAAPAAFPSEREAERHPYLTAALRETAAADDTALARSLRTAARALAGMSVLIDGSILEAPVTGTQLHILELAMALAHQPGLRLRLLVPERLDPEASGFLDLAPRVERCSLNDAAEHGPADIYHRPFQVHRWDELDRAAGLGRRLVITHQDLIGFDNPTYSPSGDAWVVYRRLTTEALRRADAVLTFSKHVAGSLLRAGLSDPERTMVVGIGIDHSWHQRDVTPLPIPDAGSVRSPMLLCIGNDFRHKNRLLAIRIAEQLAQTHDWTGSLVLAGQHLGYGSSAADEEAYLASRPELARRVLRLGVVTAEEKAWLFSNSAVCLYPTTVEGFGLIPFEAASYDVPCLFAPQAALGEILPLDCALLRSWNPEQAAGVTWRLLTEPDLRRSLVDGVHSAAVEHTWKKTADRVSSAYERALIMPPRIARVSRDPSTPLPI